MGFLTYFFLTSSYPDTPVIREENKNIIHMNVRLPADGANIPKHPMLPIIPIKPNVNIVNVITLNNITNKFNS